MAVQPATRLTLCRSMGAANKDNPPSTGRHVCRDFACMVKLTLRSNFCMTSLNAVNHISFPSISTHNRAVILDFADANLWDVPQLGQVITL